RPEPCRHRIRPSISFRFASPRSAHFPLSGVSTSWGPNCIRPTRPTATVDTVASYTAIPATRLCTHTPTTESTLPQESRPKSRSVSRAPADRGLGVESSATTRGLEVVVAGHQPAQHVLQHRQLVLAPAGGDL